MICPNCGFDNPGGSFCGKCGTPLAVQAASVPQPPTPKPKNKKMMIAIVAVVVVVVLVLAAVMVILPKNDQSTPTSALTNYLDGVKGKDAYKIIDSTIMHFDTANRTFLASNLTSQWTNTSMINVTITSSADIPMSSAPANITRDVTNFTNALQKMFSITVQESQFVKVTIKQTNSSTDYYSSTAYLLTSKVDGKWYFDMIVSYTPSDWAKDRSMNDVGWGFNIDNTSPSSTTPTGSLYVEVNNTGIWYLSISSLSPSTVPYTDCEFQLVVGNHTGTIVQVPDSISSVMTLSVNAGPATGYSMTIYDYGSGGYLSVGDYMTLGPINKASGLNAIQHTGTQFTLLLRYVPTGEVIASATFTV